MKEKMSRCSNCCIRCKNHSGVGVGRKMRWKFRGSDVGKFRARVRKMLEYQNGPKTKREDGEEEKEFRMLKSDDKSAFLITWSW